MDTKAEIRPKILTPVNHRGGGPMLSEVITCHERFAHPLAVAGNIGDAYLLNRNPVIRNAREAVMKLGYRFSSEQPREYFSFPVMSLDYLIGGRVLPYYENFIWLKRLEARAPGRFGFTALTRFDLRYNYLLHESAHCLAFRHFHGELSPDEVPKTFDAFFLAILSEAFANATEVLAGAFIDGEIGRYFLHANSYQPLDSSDVAILLTAARDHGFEACQKALTGYFLYANFLYDTLGEAEISGALRFVGLPERSPRLRNLSSLIASFSEGFRLDTSTLHLIQQGYSDEQLSLLGKDPVLWLEERPGLSRRASEGLNLLSATIAASAHEEFLW